MAGEFSRFKPGVNAATVQAATRLAGEMPNNAGSGWTILNSGFGFGIN